MSYDVRVDSTDTVFRFNTASASLKLKSRAMLNKKRCGFYKTQVTIHVVFPSVFPDNNRRPLLQNVLHERYMSIL